MSGKLFVIALMATILLCFVGGCGPEEETSGETPAASTTNVAGSSRDADGHYEPHIDQKAPTFSLPDLQGATVNLADVVGKNTVGLVFWGIWCPHCRDEIPAMINLQTTYQEKGLQIVSVAVKEDRAIKFPDFKKGVVDFVDEYPQKINYPVLLDDQYEATLLYHLHGVPTIV